MRTPVIVVRNAQRKVRIQTAELTAFAERALRQAMQVRGALVGNLAGVEEIAVVLVSDRRIAELHRRFMNIAGPTDVLTFQHGEIVVSAETARRNARTFRTSAEKEVQLYIVHGLLHLLGFDDQRADRARKMGETQERILRELTGG